MACILKFTLINLHILKYYNYIINLCSQINVVSSLLITFYVSSFSYTAALMNLGNTKKKVCFLSTGWDQKKTPGRPGFFFFSRNIFFLVYFRDHPAYNGENRLKIGQKMTEIYIYIFLRK